MSYPYKFHQEATEEFAKAYTWYEAQQKGQGERFAKSVERCLENISEHPGYYTRIHLNFRQAKVEDFPFTIVFELFPRKKTIHIASIHHTRRNPRKRYRRIN